MFDNIGRVAEQVATSVSRRGFLGSLGSWAAAAATMLAGVLTTTASARAGDKAVICCVYGGTHSCTAQYFKCYDQQTFQGCGTCDLLFANALYSARSCKGCAEVLGAGCDLLPCPFPS